MGGAERSGSGLPLKGLSTHGQGQKRGPIGSKLSRSDDADDDEGQKEGPERTETAPRKFAGYLK